jgi:hypothetical protein
LRSRAFICVRAVFPFSRPLLRRGLEHPTKRGFHSMNYNSPRSDVSLEAKADPETPELADSLECTAQAALEERDLALLSSSLERCAEVRLQVLGPEHPDTIRALAVWNRFVETMYVHGGTRVIHQGGE